MWCEEWKETSYLGETVCNAYYREKEHLDLLEAKSEESVLWLHSVNHHQGRQEEQYRMRATSSFSDSLDRQVMEGVNISNYRGEVLINRKNEMGTGLKEPDIDAGEVTVRL